MNPNPMLFVTTLDELAPCGGADQMHAYRIENGFAEYVFLYAHVLHGSQAAIYATFHNVAAGGGRSTLNISAVRDQGGWRCHHLEALAPALSLWSGAGAGSR